MIFESTCYATYNPTAWSTTCGGPVAYHRRSDLYLCERHAQEYDAMGTQQQEMKINTREVGAQQVEAFSEGTKA